MNGSAPAAPTRAVPAQAPGSVRRTSYVDVLRVGTDLVVDATARDVRGGAVLAHARLSARVSGDRTVTALELTPDTTGLERLLGLRAASGWRSAAHELVPDGVAALLLDDLPIAVLLAPYVDLRAGATVAPDGWRDSIGHMRDYCSGWAGDATMFRSIDAGAGLPPMPFVPAPALDVGPQLEPGTLRRARRIDVHPAGSDGSREVAAWFRDSCLEPQGREGVLHEYEVGVTLGPDGVVQAVRVDPRVLPWPECPAAAASGQRLVGHPMATAARDVVPSFSGVGSCTHLSDLLRSLSDAGRLGAAADG